jgi:DNA mismatch repair protein MSH5
MHGKFHLISHRFASKPAKDLDKHLGDLYPLIIGMFHNFKIRQAQRTKEDRELEIIQELAESVLPFAEAISEACDICAELDCLLCFSEATSLYNYRRPRMCSENVIKIQQGRYDCSRFLAKSLWRSDAYFYRHPLQEQTVDTFVPNDIFLVGGAGVDSFPDLRGIDDDIMSEGNAMGNSVLICTGANACGKVRVCMCPSQKSS